MPFKILGFNPDEKEYYTMWKGIKTVYPVPPEGDYESWGPWFVHPEPATEPIIFTFGPGRWHMVKKLTFIYRNLENNGHYFHIFDAQYDGFVREGYDIISATAIRLRRISMDELAIMIRDYYSLKNNPLRVKSYPGINLAEAYLYGINLFDADISDAYMPETNLEKANLSRANLRSATLRQANLHKADLSNATLIDANLSDANLTDANLDYVDFTYTKLRGSNLTGARLTNAKLSNSYTYFDENTIMPDGKKYKFGMDTEKFTK